MLFLSCSEELPHLRGFVDIMCSTAMRRCFSDGLWTIAICTLWDHWDHIRLPTAYTRKLAFGRRIRLQRSSPTFLGWHNCEGFAIPSYRCLTLSVLTPAWWSEGCKPACALSVPMAPFFTDKSFLSMPCASDDYMQNISVAKYCDLHFFTFHKICRFGVPAGFCHDLDMELAKDRDLGVLCAIPF